ncbi:MAG: HlyD family secretion protein [Anaerolineales bacterium]
MHKSRLRRAAPMVVLLAVGVGAVLYLGSVSGPDNGPLGASGTVEAVQVPVGSENAGRVVEVLAGEGQTVHAGEILMRLDDSLLAAQRRTADAAASAASAGRDLAAQALGAAHVQYEIARAAARAQDRANRIGAWTVSLPFEFDRAVWYFSQAESITAATAELQAAEADLDLKIRTLDTVRRELRVAEAEERLAAAEEGFRTAQEVLERAERSRDDQGIIDEAEALADAAEEELEAAQQAYDDLPDEAGEERLGEARLRVALAQARRDAAFDRLNQLRTGDFSLSVEAARAGVLQAEAALAQAEAALALTTAELERIDLQVSRMAITAPVDGAVLTRAVEPGQVVSPGSPLFVIADLSHLTITVFLPEDRYGQVGLGDPATVRVDSFPDQTFPAEVLRIADRAEFTPRNVQTEEGRRTTVFAVELLLHDPEGFLKPGMPADLTFDTP